MIPDWLLAPSPPSPLTHPNPLYGMLSKPSLVTAFLNASAVTDTTVNIFSLYGEPLHEILLHDILQNEFCVLKRRSVTG